VIEVVVTPWGAGMLESGCLGGTASPLRWISFLAALLSGGAFSQLNAQQPLKFEVDQSHWAARTGAPLPLRLKVTCSSLDIIEGDLEIRIQDNFGGAIASIQIPDLVYSPGRQEVEYLLPIQSHMLTPPVKVDCYFRDRKGRTFVSNGLLIPPTRRSFVVPIVQDGQANGGGDDYAWLSLEARCPKHSVDASSTPMLTLMSRVTAEDLPRDPLKHTAHDIVVIEASGFCQMVGAQVQALEAWVRGGGSLFLQFGADELSTEQQGFVDRLVSSNPDQLSHEVEGTKLIPIVAGAKFSKIESGIGQVLLTTQRSWAAADDRDRNEAFGFLWRLRKEQFDSVRKDGRLTLSLAQQESKVLWNGYDYAQNQYQAYQNQLQLQLQNAGGVRVPNATSENDDLLRFWERTLLAPRSSRPNELIQSLMPRDVQTVPIWLLSSIILAYIAAIGFGDYIVLGKLKRRRWTWFTFPAMTLAVSLLSIGTAKGYLGSSQELNVVEFRDVAEDGLIARIQRFELHFRSSPEQHSTSLNEMVFTPVASQSVDARSNPNMSRQQPDDTQLIAIQGVPTQQALAFQQLFQWRPQLNQTMSFPRNHQAPLTLALPKPGVAWSSPEYMADLAAQTQKAFPHAIFQEIFLEQGATGLSNALIQRQEPESIGCYQLAATCQRQNSASPNSPLGVFSLFNQISPSADVCLADMVIATPEHAVLCVAEREPTGELVIYRWRMRVTP